MVKNFQEMFARAKQEKKIFSNWNGPNYKIKENIKRWQLWGYRRGPFNTSTSDSSLLWMQAVEQILKNF